MKRSLGFTWMEMLITLGVTIILATLSMITYHDFLLRNAVSRTLNQLSNAMLYARSQAVLQNAKVLLCGSRDQWHCDGDWQAGQIVVCRDKLLRVFPGISPRLRLSWTGNFNQNAAILFSENGSTSGQQGSFELFNLKQRFLAKIVVTHSGRLRLEKFVASPA